MRPAVVTTKRRQRHDFPSCWLLAPPPRRLVVGWMLIAVFTVMVNAGTDEPPAAAAASSSSSPSSAPSAGGSPTASSNNSNTTNNTSGHASSSASSSTPCKPFSLTPPDSDNTRWIIAHRGASAHLPEHSLPAYRLAMELGATFIEPDLVPTRDGDLVALHTPDLNVTTNVASVFGNDRQWFSPYANRTSWWSFNFTSEELVQSLTLLQRLANARTQLYDHLFRIPTLLDVVKLVNEWNQEDVPQWSIPVSATTVLQESGRTGGEQAAPSSKHPPIGIYAELKDTAWLLHDANIDLVQLFFAHLDEHAQDWKNLWNSRGHACHGNRNGVVPPLVIQSFDATSLQSFRNHYNDHQLSSQVGEPPYVLLVSAPACFSDQFWFDFGNSDINGVNGTGVDLRSLVSGIGPDKLCLLDKERGQAVMDKAHQYGLEIHPWTSRPEFSTLSGNGDGSSSESGSAAASASAIKLDSSMQELAHLFCECRAGGVFAEAVATAVQVAALGCYNWKEGTDTNGTSASGEGGTAGVPATPVVPPTASPASGSGSGVDCPSSSTSAASESSPSSSSSAPQSSSIYVPLLCFALGVAVTLIAVAWWNHRRTQSGSSYQSRRQYRVGTTDEYGNHDLELT